MESNYKYLLLWVDTIIDWKSPNYEEYVDIKSSIIGDFVKYKSKTKNCALFRIRDSDIPKIPATHKITEEPEIPCDGKKLVWIKLDDVIVNCYSSLLDDNIIGEDYSDDEEEEEEEEEEEDDEKEEDTLDLSSLLIKEEEDEDEEDEDEEEEEEAEEEADTDDEEEDGYDGVDCSDCLACQIARGEKSAGDYVIHYC